MNAENRWVRQETVKTVENGLKRWLQVERPCPLAPWQRQQRDQGDHAERQDDRAGRPVQPQDAHAGEID